jgi:hypothetical protein
MAAGNPSIVTLTLSKTCGSFPFTISSARQAREVRARSEPTIDTHDPSEMLGKKLAPFATELIAGRGGTEWYV